MNIRPLHDRVVIRRMEENQKQLGASFFLALRLRSQIRVRLLPSEQASHSITEKSARYRCL